ncbi:hypothetical protein ABPG72_020229 [Tetrahymena utriculariae]
MPPKKKDELKQIVPVYNADKAAPLFWKYQQYSLEDRQLFDAFFLNFQKELQIKMTDNIYTNMEFLSQSIGSKIHPLFKQVSQDEQMEAKTLKQIDLEEQKKQQEADDIAKTSKNVKNQVQPQADPKNQKKDDQKGNAATAGKEDPKKGTKKDENIQQGAKDPKKATQLELLESEEEIKQEMLPYLLISTQRIDYLTMKMIIFQLPFTNISTIKLHNNMFDDETLELLISYFNSDVSQKIKKLFFEWNNLISSQKRTLFFQTVSKSIYIDNLILRCNSLQDEITSVISQQLIPSTTTPSSNIKFLDLYDNQIRIEGFQQLGKMIYKNKSLTTLGLCKNGISNVSQIEQILISIGKYPMSEEQYQAYRNSEKERDQIIERNKKLKGKKLLEAEPVPELEAIEQITENKWAITRNNTLSMLNLSLNQLNDESIERFESFLQVVHDNFQVILSFNSFEQRAKERLKKKFNKKIAL